MNSQWLLSAVVWSLLTTVSLAEGRSYQVVSDAPPIDAPSDVAYGVPDPSPSDAPAPMVPPEPSPADAGAYCCSPCCGECCEESGLGLYTFAGFDSWHGIADGSFSNNNGASFGVNAAGAVNEETGLAWQVGASFGIYDWFGRESIPFEASQSQQQTFVTAGLFRRANETTPWSSGIVVDQMLGNNFGVFSTEPYLAQVRYQIAYAMSPCNEVGVWATNQLNQSSQTLGPAPFAFTTRAVNQANLFWHHKFELGADSWFYVGVPTNDHIGPPGLGPPGRLGDWIVGGMFNAPLNDGLALYGNFAYMKPSAPTVLGVEEESFNVSVGLAWYPYCNARSRTVAGRTWMPYLPVANNGTFLVDQNVTF